MWLVVLFRDGIIDLFASEGREDCRESSDEARCTEGIFLQAGVKEDRFRKHQWGFCGSGVLEGDDEDPLSSRDREAAQVPGGHVVAACETDRGVGSRFEPVDETEI